MNIKWYDRAKKMMKSRGITQNDLIEIMGVSSRGAVGHYLSGRREPGPTQLLALATVLECSLDELMGTIDPEHLLVLKVLQASKIAMQESGEEFNAEEKQRIYRACADYAISAYGQDIDLDKFVEKFVNR